MQFNLWYIQQLQQKSITPRYASNRTPKMKLHFDQLPRRGTIGQVALKSVNMESPTAAQDNYNWADVIDIYTNLSSLYPEKCSYPYTFTYLPN